MSHDDELPPILDDEEPPLLQDEEPPIESVAQNPITDLRDRAASLSSSLPDPSGLTTYWKPLAAIASILVVAGLAYSLWPKQSAPVAGEPHQESDAPEEESDEAIGSDSANGSPTPRDKEISNLKQIALGLTIYTTDHDDMLPYDMSNRDLIYPYVKNGEMFSSHYDGTPYSANRELDLTSATSIENLAEAVAYFGPVWNDGQRGVAYVDSHVKWRDQSLTMPRSDSLIPGGHPSATPAVSAAPPTQAFEMGQLKTIELGGKVIKVPIGWEYKHISPSASTGGVETHRWAGPTDEAFVRFDSGPSDSKSLLSMVQGLESGFKRSSHYRYERIRLREGSEAYQGGVIWNFRISKDGEPMQKRTIAYVRKGGRDYAVLVNCQEDVTGYAEMYTAILNCLKNF